MLFEELDHKLSAYSPKLRDDLGIDPPASLRLASAIRDEIRALPVHLLPTLAGDSPLALKDRWEMLNLLIGWLDSNHDYPDAFGQIVTVNYIAFVYFGDTCFKVLRKELPKGTIAQKCCVYLTDNPVRAFRNAIAHGNWRFCLDRSGIDFWARKGADPEEEVVRWRFVQNDLSFSQYLAIATAFSTMATL